MRFTYTKTNVDQLPAMSVQLADDDNLATLNQGPQEPDAYFTSGDLVFNYVQSTGEVVGFDGYLPYFDSLPKAEIDLPKEGVAARLLVGDLTDPIFSIEKLPLEISKDGTILHAGDGKSAVLLQLSKDIFVGLTDEQITDVYFRLHGKA